MRDQIINAAQEAFKQRLKDSNDVSKNTINAQEIAKVWRKRCWLIDPDRIRIEETVHPDLNQRIDVIDTQKMWAYEFKVSGKNATSEFYKDIVKIIVWNEKREKKIERLVFITEDEWGRKYLDTAMPQAFVQYLGKNGLHVDVAYVKHETHL